MSAVSENTLVSLIREMRDSSKLEQQRHDEIKIGLEQEIISIKQENEQLRNALAEQREQMAAEIKRQMELLIPTISLGGVTGVGAGIGTAAQTGVPTAAATPGEEAREEAPTPDTATPEETPAPSTEAQTEAAAASTKVEEETPAPSEDTSSGGSDFSIDKLFGFDEEESDSSGDEDYRDTDDYGSEEDYGTSDEESDSSGDGGFDILAFIRGEASQMMDMTPFDELISGEEEVVDVTFEELEQYIKKRRSQR